MRNRSETRKGLKNEVERLRQTVSGGGGGGAASSSGGGRRTATGQSQPPAGSTGRPVSVDERKKQAAQLAEMGVSIPDEFRGELSMAGEWQTTSVKVIEPENGDSAKRGKGKESVGIGVRKRKMEGRDDEEDGEHGHEPERFVSKTWGQRTREYPGAQGDDEDLDALLETTKNVKKAKPSGPDDGNTETEDPKEETGDAPDPTQGKDGDDSADVVSKLEEKSQVKEEGPSDAAASAVKGEPEEPESGVVFKKRKPKTIRK